MDKAKLLPWWPVILAVGGTILTFGVLQTNVTTTMQRVEALEQGSPQVQERITRIEEQQKAIREDIAEIKNDIKDIAKAGK